MSYQQPYFRGLSSDGLAELLEEARNAPYWRPRLPIASHPFDAERELGKVTPVTSDDLRQHCQPGPETMLTKMTPAGCFLFSSGGSRGNPKLTYRDFSEFEDQGRYFDGLEIGPGDVVANLFSAGIWGAFSVHNIGLVQRGCTILPLGSTTLDSAKIDETITIMRLGRVNVLAGSPSAIIPAGRKLPPDVVNSITKIYCTGELITKAVENAIHSSFPYALLRSTYATSDAGGVGVQCTSLEGARYHPFPKVLIEFLDNQNRPTAHFTMGNITVTKTIKRTLPIIRYQPGDEGCWEKNGCGEHPDVPVFRVFGRVDQMIGLASTMVPLTSFSIAIEQALGAAPLHTIVVSQIGGLDHVQCRIEGVNVTAPVVEQIQAELCHLEPDLARLIEAERCWPVSAISVDSGELERSAISGKVKDFIDLRRKSVS
jgi:phenylacetate-CoA ligase